MMEEMEILSHEQHKLQGGEKRFQLQTGPDFTKCDVIGNYIDLSQLNQEFHIGLHT